MPDKKIIVVAGATGAQGGGLAWAVLDIARSLNPSLQMFDQWLAENKNRIPLEERKASV